MHCSPQKLYVKSPTKKLVLLSKREKHYFLTITNKDFDDPMGCFDGEEVSEIVETYILSKISNEINKKASWTLP